MSTHQTAKTQYAVADNGTKFAYRRLGTGPGTPLLLLMHFRGTMDRWDPLLVNTLAASRPLILVDYAGVGLSTGEVATSVRQSAADIATFLGLIGESEVDVLGFSIGGAVGQLLALNADPANVRVRKLILAGTGPSNGPEIKAPLNEDWFKHAGGKDITIDNFSILFFPQNQAGRMACQAWWERIHERTEATSGEQPADYLSQGHKDGGKGVGAQATQAGLFVSPETSRGLDGSYDRLGELKLPVLVANGHDDYMIPTANSFVLQQKVPNGQLIIYPDSGHGFLFQYAQLFAKHVVLFLEA